MMVIYGYLDCNFEKTDLKNQLSPFFLLRPTQVSYRKVGTLYTFKKSKSLIIVRTYNCMYAK